MFIEWQCCLVIFGRYGGFDGGCGVGVGGVGQGVQFGGVLVWLYDVDLFVVVYLVLVVDDVWQVDGVIGQGGQFGVQLGLFWGFWCIVVYWFVGWNWYLGDCVYVCQYFCLGIVNVWLIR